MHGVILPPLPRKHWATIGFTEIGQIGQPIGGDFTLCIALRALKISCKCEGWVAVENLFIYLHHIYSTIEKVGETGTQNNDKNNKIACVRELFEST